jgi:hypothetical protein
MAYVQKNLDDQPLFEGTHKGASSDILYDPGADFKSCGVTSTNYIENVTKGTNMNALSDQLVLEDKIMTKLDPFGVLPRHWANGDTYKIYVTATKGSKISQIYTDKRYGRKVTEKKELVGGLFPADVDLDEYEDNIFGPGQPRKEYMR